jgi:hypothetical protein
MISSLERSLVSKLIAGVALFVGLIPIAGLSSPASTVNFAVPQDTAVRIRLDDTLTSTDSEVGDPFSATVVDAGEYQSARVYGHIAEIDKSGKVKGRTSIMLRFDRLVMPDGRRTPIHAEIVEL